VPDPPAKSAETSNDFKDSQKSGYGATTQRTQPEMLNFEALSPPLWLTSAFTDLPPIYRR
jgi:hypothetical protein